MLGERHVPLGMPETDSLGFVGGIQPFAPVLADCRQHGEPSIVTPRTTQKALVEQRVEALKNVLAGLSADGLGCVEGPTAGEDGEPPENLRVTVAEEPVAPVDRRA